MDNLLDTLPDGLRRRLAGMENKGLTELRLRAGQAMELRGAFGSRLVGEAISQRELDELVCEMTGYSIYAREEQICRGYFTLPGGHRVGLTGVYAQGEHGIMALRQVNALCVRVAREVIGAAVPLLPHILQEGRPMSTLVLSPPGLGKTTLLRDAARLLSERGLRVAVVDERDELAALDEGVPTMNLGPRCDIAGGCAKREAIGRLVRAMAPDVIVTDELGDEGDAHAVQDAVRAGVAVLASAHAAQRERASRRTALAPLLREGIFERVVLLGGHPGHIEQVTDASGMVLN